MALLDQVERGTLTVSEAATKIRATQTILQPALLAPSNQEPPAKWLKIKIVDPASNFKLSLPPLPLRFTSRLAAFLLRIAMQHADASDLEPLDAKDVFLILDTLRELPPVQLVSVTDDQGTQIEIFTK